MNKEETAGLVLLLLWGVLPVALFVVQLTLEVLK